MLKIDNISKSYNNFKAVNNLNIEIKDGECWTLLGRNGAGKSTTIKMVVGLLKPDSGKITFDGTNIYDKPLDIKKKFSYIPDVPYVYEKMKGIDFLYFIGRMYGITNETIKEKSLNLSKLFNIEDILNKNTESYSHGMKQKLIFCSAFLTNPNYIILDEPMVGLDPQSQKIVKDIIKDLTSNFGVKILLSTHQISTAKEISTKIGIIHNGELKTILNNDESLKTEDIENEFLKITGDYKKDYIKRIRN